MTPKLVHKKISKLSKMLPPMYYDNRVEHIKVLGSVLIASGTVKTSSNIPIEAEQYYIRDVQKPINHRKELEKAYLKYGNEGMIKYCFEIEEMSKRNKK